MIDVLSCRDTAGDMEAPVADWELNSWTKYSMLPPGRGGRETTQRKLTEMRIFNASKDTAELEQTLLSQAKQWSPDFAWVPRPLSLGTAYFLVLFSGHRRFADIAQWFTWKSNAVPICIDLAVDPLYGNIMRDDLWKRLIRARKVTGAHAGPPCETYSFARWIEVEHGGGPRPLRTTGAPKGKHDLNLKEVQQVFTGLCFHHATSSGSGSAKGGFPTRPFGATIPKTYVHADRKVRKVCVVAVRALPA